MSALLIQTINYGVGQPFLYDGASCAGASQSTTMPGMSQTNLIRACPRRQLPTSWRLDTTQFSCLNLTRSGGSRRPKSHNVAVPLSTRAVQHINFSCMERNCNVPTTKQLLQTVDSRHDLSMRKVLEASPSVSKCVGHVRGLFESLYR